LVFDLLSLDAVDGVLFDTGLSTHPRLLGALGRLGAGFLCRSAGEAHTVLRHAMADPASCVLPVGSPVFAGAWEGLPPGWMPAVPLDGAIPVDPASLGGREVLLIPAGASAPDKEAAARERVRALERAQVRIRGFYVPPFAAEIEAAPAPAEWPLLAGKDGILIPGGGTGVALDRETGLPDLAGTAERLEGWKGLFPDGRLRLEPGAGFFSAVAALVTKEGEEVRVRGPAPPGSLDSRRGSRTRSEERFLNARRICPVPL
jgi:hypothetical protein